MATLLVHVLPARHDELRATVGALTRARIRFAGVQLEPPIVDDRGHEIARACYLEQDPLSGECWAVAVVPSTVAKKLGSVEHFGHPLLTKDSQAVAVRATPGHVFERGHLLDFKAATIEAIVVTPAGSIWQTAPVATTPLNIDRQLGGYSKALSPTRRAVLDRAYSVLHRRSAPPTSGPTYLRVCDPVRVLAEMLGGPTRRDIDPRAREILLSMSPGVIEARAMVKAKRAALTRAHVAALTPALHETTTKPADRPVIIPGAPLPRAAVAADVHHRPHLKHTSGEIVSVGGVPVKH
jgi:hypothetical protein